MVNGSAKQFIPELCLKSVSTMVRTWAVRVCSGLARQVQNQASVNRNRFVPSLAEVYTVTQSRQILEAPMELHGVKTNVRPCAMFIVAIVCSIAFYVPVAGQSGGDPAKAQMEEMTRRELQLNNLGGDHGHPNDPKRSQAMMNQVSEDFQRILTRHNEIFRALAPNQTLNYQFISDAPCE